AGPSPLNESTSTLARISTAGGTAFGILAAISFCHLLNDMMQSLLPALYPMLRGSYRLSFTQIGLLTFTFQFTASLLQPLVGLFADRSPRPYSLAAGMGFTLAGLLGIVLLINVGHWYKTHGITRLEHAARSQPHARSRARILLAIAVLLALVFSKYVYLASLTSYYTFYLIDHFHVSVRHAQ